MKKYAVVFYGLIGYSHNDYKGVELNPLHSYKTFFRHLLFPNYHQVDIFIHTWKNGYVQGLADLYEPVSLTVETQRFPQEPVKNCWYSMKQGLEAVRNYENLNHQKYDLVMLSRLDLFFLTDFKFSDYDPNFMHIQHGWTCSDPPRVVCDYYFLSSSDHMQGLSKLFENISPEYPANPHTTIGRFIHDRITSNFKLDKRLYYDMQMVRRIHSTIVRSDWTLEKLASTYDIPLEFLKALPVDTN